MILTDILLPGSGSASLIRIRIREAKMMRIRPDPDPHHWFPAVFAIQLIPVYCL